MGLFDRSGLNFTALAGHREMFEVMREEGFVWDVDYRVDGRVRLGAWVGLRLWRGSWVSVHVVY